MSECEQPGELLIILAPSPLAPLQELIRTYIRVQGIYRSRVTRRTGMEGVECDIKISALKQSRAQESRFLNLPFSNRY